MHNPSNPSVPKVSVRGLTGIVFRAEGLRGYCFVPDECVSQNGTTYVVDRAKYIASGYAARNLRIQPQAGFGSHLFPDQSAPVRCLAGADVVTFLTEIERAA